MSGYKSNKLAAARHRALLRKRFSAEVNLYLDQLDQIKVAENLRADRLLEAVLEAGASSEVPADRPAVRR